MIRIRARHLLSAIVITALALTSSCSDDSVDDEEAAEQAYLGLDKSVDRAMQLGFDGFNAASSANIPLQTGQGDSAGSMTVGGKVDQGASANKEMTLDVTLTGYSDGPVFETAEITYNGGLVLGLSLKGLPDADISGTMTGTVQMQGHLQGSVTLNLTITGKTEDDGAGKIQRKAGSILVSGTATSDFGTFTVNVTK